MPMAIADLAGAGSGMHLEPLTILIVDDDPPILTGLSEFLEGEGYHVAVAGDGRAALDQLRRGLRPSVIVLDLMMPVMDGWDFRHEQLKDAELREIPVVVITATGFSEQSVRKQLGAVELVPKPPSLERLLGAIQRCCGEPLH